MIDVKIPLPPSVNDLYANRRNGRGRIKTRRYKQWINAAGWELLYQRARPIYGRYHMVVFLPHMRGDPDNRLKALCDLFVAHDLIIDDSIKYCAGIEIVLTEEKDSYVRVVITGDTDVSITTGELVDG